MALHRDGGQKNRLREVALLFLKLGVTAFGGPAVHIAMMEEEVVRRRKWMTRQDFMDLVGATNLVPGPNSTELTMHCGRLRAGWPGFFVAGLCFILPAVIITAVIAWMYQAYGTLPNVQHILYGIKPAVIGVVFSLVVVLGRNALKSFPLVITGVISAIAAMAGVHEIIVLFVAGIAYAFIMSARGTLVLFPFMLLQIAERFSAGNMQIFWIFLKVGSLLYGSGYVLFAFLDAELVNRGLLTAGQLADAIAVGQFTPGPVFSSATFIGWQLAGAPGAIAATAGIFLPAFVFVALLNPLIPLLRRSKIMSAFLDAVNAASVALIFSVGVDMARVSIMDIKTAVIAVAGFAAVIFFKKLNTAFIIAGGALAGLLLWNL
ncbi:MAG TPA: chromate efflux transporter [Flavisolibacter sp.]